MMAQKSFKASAPGSLMLFGEYSVLYGKKAIACAINKKIAVTLVPRHDRFVTISSKLGNCRGVLQLKPKNLLIKPRKPLQFILATIQTKLKKIKHGFDLTIASEFSPQLGFGSSAAVTVATLTVLKQLVEEKIDRLQIFKEAKQIVQNVQKEASGTDVAASVWGGLVINQINKKPILLKASFPLVTIYSGSKFPTKQAIARFKKIYRKNPKLYDLLFEISDLCSDQAIKAIKKQDWKRLGILMNFHQGIQDAFGTNNSTLARMLLKLRKEKNIFGAKISGSGLGDSIIGLGKIIHDKTPIKIIK